MNRHAKLREFEMEVAKIKRNYQLTIPRSIRKKMKLAVGDHVEIDVEGNQVIIKPLKLIHADQEYFYTKEWQDKEAEADKDIEKGDLMGPFENANDALKALKKAEI